MNIFIRDWILRLDTIYSKNGIEGWKYEKKSGKIMHCADFTSGVRESF